MNIEKVIWSHAESLGLDWIATGGGCDFIYRGIGELEEEGIGNRISLVLGHAEDQGLCPDTLEDPSTVVIYINDPEWQEGTYITFPTAAGAMAFMAQVTNVILTTSGTTRWGAHCE